MTKMKRVFSIAIVLMTALFAAAAVYEPSLENDSEVCVFFEADATASGAPCIWVWEGNTDGRQYVGTAWPGPEMTYMGDTQSGNRIYKWTYTGTLAMPTGLIFTWNNQTGRVDGSFTNHGYYVMGQLTKVIGAGESTFVPNQNVIYQLDLYNFTSQGTLAAAQQRLDYLKDLGIDIIWLMVWLDWVANHTAKDNVWITQHREYYNSTLTSPNGYGDVYQLDYSKEATQQAMIEAMEYWIDQADIDGYRCDYISSNTIPTSFWTRAIKALKEHKPGKTITMLGEGDMANSVQRLLGCGWDYDYAWGFQTSLVNNKNRPANVLTQCRNLVGDLRFVDMSRMVYLTNHDQNYSNTMQSQYGSNAYAFTVLTFTLYGMPLLYNGQETGYLLNHCLDYFNRTPINWNAVDSKMQNTVKALTALKHSCDALIDNGDRASEVTFMTTGNSNVIAYQRSHNNQKCLVVLNLGTSSASTTVTGLEAGEWKRAIDVENISVGLTAIPVTFSATQSFVLPAGGYQVYIKGEPMEDFLRGDVNGDGEVNISDITALVDILLGGSMDKYPFERIDVNGDGEINITDVTILVDLLIKAA